MLGFPFDEYLIGVLGLAALAVLLLKIDWTPGRYKVMFHEGPDVGIKTKMSTGWLTIADGEIKISGPEPLSRSLASVRSVGLFRLHGLGRMVRITHDNGTLFVTVVRFCIAGQFASVDFFKTGKLVALIRPSMPAV